MKSKLLKKLRRRFADTHKVEWERSLLFGDYHFTLQTRKEVCVFGETCKGWVCDGVFSTEEGVRCSEYFRKC